MEEPKKPIIHIRQVASVTFQLLRNLEIGAATRSELWLAARDAHTFFRFLTWRRKMTNDLAPEALGTPRLQGVVIIASHSGTTIIPVRSLSEIQNLRDTLPDPDEPHTHFEPRLLEN